MKDAQPTGNNPGKYKITSSRSSIFDEKLFQSSTLSPKLSTIIEHSKSPSQIRRVLSLEPYQIMDSEIVELMSQGLIVHQSQHQFYGNNILTHCRKPFTGKTDSELIKLISENEITIDAKLDENLQILIQALLTKDPIYRPNIQQLYFSKWIKYWMKLHNIFNKYEYEKLKHKFINQNIEIKSVDNCAIQQRIKTIISDSSLSHSISTQLSNCDMNESGIVDRYKYDKL